MIVPMTLASRQNGLKRLEAFLPRAGRSYAARRNHDFGPDQRDNVSVLSPWIRHRLITEQEVVKAVLDHHSASAAEKFIQEVCWRTYWKGWLEMRPGVWQGFLRDLDADRAEVDSNSGLQAALDEAESGRTGIDAFDHWARELVATGYLHNHARMWFASIWIFTLKLPWTLGAHFFLRHLLDADPASNTCGWRWVAGIQTRGKTYLARASNIEKFTDGRFRPTELATEAPALEWQEPPRPRPLEATPTLAELTDSPALLLIHPEDLAPESLVPATLNLKAAMAFSAVEGTIDWPFGDKARAFVEEGVADAADRVQQAFGLDSTVTRLLDPDAVVTACREADVSNIITPCAPVGPVAEALKSLQGTLGEAGIRLYRLRRDWDSEAWPNATRGFFPFKKKIPDLLEATGLT
jgi:hypothetical protein